MDTMNKMPELDVGFSLAEESPLLHELLSLRQTAGQARFNADQFDPDDTAPLYAVSARLGAAREPGSLAKLVGVVSVVEDVHRHLYIQDFIVMPQYQGSGLSRMMLERVLAFAQRRAAPGTCLRIHALGEDERLCHELGFVSSHCANLGPNLSKLLQ
ncbi:GNAT family N-acetyltransferase [Shewanella salipaludis]|uniref:GNAT family N-acetyltransferase n=1 Tax=Shewanella salipaludis TaxID=2723052 RepID=A0A972JKT6_9GAMM|nr:GNAT family N-acetyltransferase [Shewanella salipaludis]NMH65484.1 GNAT family N-acetyltransferase [Shewanella salipaludis]